MNYLLRVMALSVALGAVACGGSADDETFGPETDTNSSGIRTCASLAQSYHNNCERYGGTAECNVSGSTLDCSCSWGNEKSAECVPDVV